MKLSELTKGKRAVVSTYQAEIGRPDLYKRLLLMGLRPGAEVEMVGRAPLGDPYVVRVRNQGFGLRRELTELIQVTPCD